MELIVTRRFTLPVRRIGSQYVAVSVSKLHHSEAAIMMTIGEFVYM